MHSIKFKNGILQLVINFLLVTNCAFSQYLNELKITDTLHEYAVNFNHDRENLVGIYTYRDLSWGNWNRVGLMFNEYDQNYNKTTTTTRNL